MQNEVSEDRQEFIGEGVTWKDFGKYMREARERLGLTVEQLAQQVGCTSGAIYNYESGDIDNAYYKFLRRVQVALEIPEQMMPGAAGDIRVDYKTVTHHHDVVVDGVSYLAISSCQVTNGRPTGRFEISVFTSEGEPVQRFTPVGKTVISAVRRYHKERREKMRLQNGVPSTPADQEQGI